MKGLERLVGAARERHARAMTPRELYVVAVSAALYVAVAATLAFTIPWNRETDPVLAVALGLAFAVVSRVEFEIGSIVSVATQLVFVPILFVLPLPLVPLLIPFAYMAARVPEYALRQKHAERALYDISDAWFCIGPVVVLSLLAPGPADLDHLGVYALALAAQVVSDFVPVMTREWIVRGVSLRESLGVAMWVYNIDLVLSPIAFMVAIVAADSSAVIASILPFVWLLHVFAKDRRERHSAALELNRAYRGTVMLLSDVVEADDNYTADHCRSVVGLVNATADELGIDDDARQELEFAALLHDVGKIVIPKEILNKPGALTDEEFELMKTHTIEGQVLLDRVGGLLGRVGKIVRSCHERWDGQGYPDGLAGYEIPLEARIVFTCDAYSAMTTDRPYRSAMSQETALEELWANAGSQFDPRVVSALAQVIRTGKVIESSPAFDVRDVLTNEHPRHLDPTLDSARR